MTIEFLKRLLELYQLSMQLNALIIDEFNLRNDDRLREYPDFVLPMIAAQKKIIERRGTLNLKNNVPFKYHFHGGGITIEYLHWEIRFEYYGSLVNGTNTPIFSLYSIEVFSKSDDMEAAKWTHQKVLPIFEKCVSEGLIEILYEGYTSFYIPSIGRIEQYIGEHTTI